MYFITVIGRIVDDEKKLAGYVFAGNHDGEFATDRARASLENIGKVLAHMVDVNTQIVFTNFTFDKRSNSLNIIHGDPSFYPLMDTGGRCRAGAEMLTVVANIIDMDEYEKGNKVSVGVICVTPTNTKDYFFALDRAALESDDHHITNGEVDAIKGFQPFGTAHYPAVGYRKTPVDRSIDASNIAGYTKRAEGKMRILKGDALINAAEKLTDSETLAINNLANLLRKFSPMAASMLDTTRVIACDDATCKTMSTDGSVIYANPKFIETELENDPKQALFVLMHELYHIYFGHHLLFLQLLSEDPHANHDLFNTAADIIINDLLCREYNLSYGGGPDPTGMLKTPKVGCFLEMLVGDDRAQAQCEDNVVALYYQLLKEQQAGQPKLTLEDVVKSISEEHNKKPPEPQQSDAQVPEQVLNQMQTTEERVKTILEAIERLKIATSTMQNKLLLDGATAGRMLKDLADVEIGINSVKREQCVTAIEDFGNILISSL